MLRKRDQQSVRAIVALGVERGHVPVQQLDDYLTLEKGFDARVDALVDAIGELPLAPDLAHTVNVLPPVERDRIRSNDDDALKPYLRDLGRIQRMEKSEEIAIAKRYEFARRRLQRATVSSGLAKSAIKRLRQSGVCRTFLDSMGAALNEDVPLHDRGWCAADHIDLVRRFCNDVNRIRAEFVERNLHLVVGLAISYRTYGVPIPDLIQEGNAALIRAVEKFDWRKNVRFQTYATFWIRQAVERAIAFNRGIVRVPNYLQQKMRRLRREGVIPRRDGEVTLREMSAAFEVKPEVAGHLLETERGHFSLDVSLDENGESFASFLSDESHERQLNDLEFPMLRNRLNEVLETLTRQERQILELRYGLGGSDPLTLEEVGKLMKVSRERIRQLQVRAIRKLQRPALIDKLTGFV
ncbi:MAG: RNA polymerase sigma factor RpoD/SigA [Planctomycetota bacterium]